MLQQALVALGKNVGGGNVVGDGSRGAHCSETSTGGSVKRSTFATSGSITGRTVEIDDGSSETTDGKKSGKSHGEQS